MTANTSLTSALQKQVLLLEDDLRARVEDDPTTRDRWVAEHDRAVTHGRTASGWQAWRDDRVTQAAVAWVLATVFVRFCEDNALVRPVWLAGPAVRRQEALDAELAFYRERSREGDVTAREWLLEAVGHLASLPATAPLVDAHSPLWEVSPSGDAAGALVAFWRQKGDDGALVQDMADPSLDTRFLGDLYQDLSAYAKATFALLQTPVFVEEFILDRTLAPALADRPLDGFRMIDPSCGSGHFLLGAFVRLLDRWDRQAPGLEVQARVQLALDAVHGVDLNPFAVAIARFRLTVVALQACGLVSLTDAPAFRFHLAVGDSLLHGPGQQTLAGDADLSAFVYVTEDLTSLQTILAGGRYDAVVGNPPYITVKDKTLNQAYRERYDTCKGTYALTVPFMERFFGLAKVGTEGQQAGWVGQITSNSFMKREFGSKLIEEFLAVKDLRLVADTSGAYIPGHGTPTVILVGRNQRPGSGVVRAVLSIRGEPGRPGDPSRAVVWTAILEHVDDEPGYLDGWITVRDVDRGALAVHPWNLSGGVTSTLLRRIAGDRTTLGTVVNSIGYTGQTNADPAFMASARQFARRRVDPSAVRPFLSGEVVRDYVIGEALRSLFPYDLRGLRPVGDFPGMREWLWPSRSVTWARATFAKNTYREEGRTWWEWHQVALKRLTNPRSLVYPNVATHNHFVFDRSGHLFNPHSPAIKLRLTATEDEHLSLLGVLNSSTACFWLKQNSQSKAGSGIGRGIQSEDWMGRYEFTGTTLQDYPLPATLPLKCGRMLDLLAQRLADQAPDAVTARKVPTVDTLASARTESERLRAQMVAVQEELDWEVHRLYGLIDDDLTYPGDDLPGLALGERAFEIALARKVAAGEEETAWFARHGSTPITELPDHWPAAYTDVVQRRLDLIASDPSIGLLEKPEHKRRWATEPWDKRQERALRGWLLDRLEDRKTWFDSQGRPTPQSVAQLADRVGRDNDLVSVLALWEGRPDVPVTQSLVRLLADEAVPYLAAHRYRDSGLRKREAWEQTWALQRREDAGEQVDTIPVPPKYVGADFTKTSYWQARGKLDVPKERFVLYPAAGRETDPTPLLGWAGWDHAQQFLALSTVIAQRQAEGWDDERLVPLVAGLAELLPWVRQWHSGIDPELGVDLAQFCAEELSSRAAEIGRTIGQLADWRPATPTRGRKPRKATT